jgi:hypothetical protein
VSVLTFVVPPPLEPPLSPLDPDPPHPAARASTATATRGAVSFFIFMRVFSMLGLTVASIVHVALPGWGDAPVYAR